MTRRYGNTMEGQAAMTRVSITGGMLLAATAVVAVVNADSRASLARFDGGIGVTPISSFSGQFNPQDGTFEKVTRNFVRNVRSATQLWTIASLKADINSDGRITVDGRGMILAGGDTIGRAPAIKVVATLICEAEAPFVERNSADQLNSISFEGGAPLDVNGDFRIDETLRTAFNSNLPMPGECASPVLLIRSAGNGAWLAAGIPKFTPAQ
jgi:hypothetical protein